MKVGDIVICHDYKSIEGKKGFIEEIIDDPNTSWNKLRETGCYSVYGLEKAHFSIGDSYYFGDCIGDTLEPTGKSMTLKDLEKYKTNESNNKGMSHDIDIVIKNLGRSSGRNPERSNTHRMITELSKKEK